MAAGDEAAAAGLSVVPATADVRQGYTAINVRGDELARHMTSGGHAFTQITGQVGSTQIADYSVTTAKIANDAIINAKIADLAVSERTIGNGQVTGRTLAERTISQAKLAKRSAAGVVTVGPGPAGVYVETGLSGTVAMVVTCRDGIASDTAYGAQPDGSTGRFWIRQWGGTAGAVSWLAMEV